MIINGNDRAGGQEWKKKGLRCVMNVSRAPVIYFFLNSFLLTNEYLRINHSFE